MNITAKFLEKIFYETETNNDFIFELYLLWCESNTVNNREFQKVLANKSISKWFMLEFKKLEMEYLFDYNRYPNIKWSDNLKLYIKWVIEIFKIYPQSILKKVIKES